MRLQGFNRTFFYPGQRVCCALSGGADSTALLLALMEGNAEKDSLGVHLTAIHVHHGLRGAEADADAEFTKSLCSAHNIPLRVVGVDTRTRQEAEREGVEEAARELRYAAFRDLLASGSVDAVATAHTLDDQAETVLMKLIRGAWTDGLAGIAPVLKIANAASAVGSRRQEGDGGSMVVLRPMLEVNRTEVERFLRERHQPWQEDTSNQDLNLTRNRVRHQLMPLLRTFNPSIAETLARTANTARDDEAYWQAETARLLPGLVLPGKPVRGGGRAVSTAAGERSVAVEIDRLRPQHPALQRRLVRGACLQVGHRPSADETVKLLALAGLLDLAGLSARNGTRLELSGGLRAERSLRELRLSRSGAEVSTIPKKM